MDPDANLQEQLELAESIQNLDSDPEDAERLCQLVIALDGWISKGGFLPARWRKT